MLTRINLVWMVMLVAAAFGLYHVKYKVQALQEEVEMTGRMLDEERENLHVAQAEWTYLNRPERLQYLSKKYLELSAIRSEQIASIEAIPFPEKSLAANPEQDPSLVKATMQQAELRRNFIEPVRAGTKP